MNNHTFFTKLSSPIGELLALSDGESLTGLYYENHRRGPTQAANWRHDAGPFQRLQAELAAYFAGELDKFSLPLAPRGTEFQREVWNELLRIPRGKTLTYGELAAKVGNPKAVRAAGAANARNPISIVIPCHRVIGANAAPTGYAGGIERKQWLLRHEARQQACLAP